jgi:hypothetical protein
MPGVLRVFAVSKMVRSDARLFHAFQYLDPDVPKAGPSDHRGGPGLGLADEFLELVRPIVRKLHTLA